MADMSLDAGGVELRITAGFSIEISGPDSG